MKTASGLLFVLLLALSAVPGGAQAKTIQKLPDGKVLVRVPDPASPLVKCLICSDDLTLCVQVSC